MGESCSGLHYLHYTDYILSFRTYLHYSNSIIINLVNICVVKRNKEDNEICWMKWEMQMKTVFQLDFIMLDLVLPTNLRWNCVCYVFTAISIFFSLFLCSATTFSQPKLLSLCVISYHAVMRDNVPVSLQLQWKHFSLFSYFFFSSHFSSNLNCTNLSRGLTKANYELKLETKKTFSHIHTYSVFSIRQIKCAQQSPSWNCSHLEFAILNILTNSLEFLIFF